MKNLQVRFTKTMLILLLCFPVFINRAEAQTPTVASLVASGTGIKWYAGSTGGVALDPATPLVNGSEYWASQTVNGCESTTRFKVTATLITVAAPTTGTHTQSMTQIVWNWNTVSGATGYKWNTANDYGSSTDMSTAVTKTETGLTCNVSYTRYIWAYNGSVCVSPVTTLTQTTTSCAPDVWIGNLTHLRGNNYSFYEFLVTGITTGSIWGCNGSYYTDDTNLATAAVHSGCVLNGQTKTVRVLILPGQSSYSSCNSNGITSNSFASWGGSYQINACW